MRVFLVLTCLFFPLTSLLALSSGPYIQISQTGGNAPPVLAVANNGNAFAAWVNFPNNIQTAFFNIATNTWFSLGTLTIGSLPRVGVDGVGNGYIVWVSTTNGPATQIFVSRLNATTRTFTTPVQLSVSGTINTSPQLSVNLSGVAVVIWIQNTPFQILGASFNPTTGTWSAPTAILSNFYPATFALDNLNSGIAILDSFTTIQGAIQAARIFAP